jgi:hypothetical protein
LSYNPWGLGILALVGVFAAGAFYGAPYLPSKRRQIKLALRLLNLKPEQTVLDLGAGDGAFLVMAARGGLKGVGYEINPILWAISKWRLRHYPDVRVQLKNYWKSQLPAADGVYVFLISHRMQQLADKLTKELPGVKLASFTFKLPGHSPLAQQGGVYLYHIADK